MRFNPSDALSEEGMGWLKFAISSRMNWVVRDQYAADLGIDVQVEQTINGVASDCARAQPMRDSSKEQIHGAG
jgi:hypothetical protein